ncbi:MAG: glycosyltransferase [Lachnospiraceae bacterium]|nr:glycosyltransferase [Lachnospiraceae bacterium]MDY4097952.1 glycosyltransferase [Lachnospiraceae bacterium]
MNLWLSIIIPVYNVKKYLNHCLDSIVEQVGENYPLVEAIVVNDGSSDGSGEIADGYADTHTWISVIHQSNSGVAQARNKGLEVARGEWIYLVDSDDWIAEGGISSILSCISRNQDTDIILFDAYKNTEKEEKCWEHFSKDMIFQSGEEIHKLCREVLYTRNTPLAAPWDKVYKASFLKKNQICFQRQLKVLDDMIFNMEAFGAAEKICYYKKKIYHYRFVASSITNSYKPDRVEQDKLVWSYLQEYMDKVLAEHRWTKTAAEDFRQSCYCRIIKSFSICCRLCFFHEQNHKTFSDQINYLKQVTKEAPYHEAFKKIELKNAEWKLKIVVIMVRSNLVQGIYWLHRANTWWESKASGR